MVQYEEVRQMPFKELLMYYEALKAICERHELELRPLYNSNNVNDQIRWKEVNNEFQHAKSYFDVVLNALKYKAFNGLDNYKAPKQSDKLDEPVKKPIAKKPSTPSQRGRKKKKEEGK